MSETALTRFIGSGPLLLDFDGPVCSVFAGHSAGQVAGELVALLRARHVGVPPEIRGERDPLAVLRWVGELRSAEVIAAADDALASAELEAVRTAEPTPFARDVIVGARNRGLPIAVVSNNSEAAIRTYLTENGIAGYIATIVGRPHGAPGRMKPNPGPLLDAVQALNAAPSSCTLIGDSLTDIEAARAAGVSVVGFANRPWKVEAFTAADAVVTSMRDVAQALSPVCLQNRHNLRRCH